MSQLLTDEATGILQKRTGRLRQILPLIVAMVPAVCGLGFQIAGPRPQQLKERTSRLPLAFHQYMVNLGAVPVQRSHAAAFSFTNHSDKAMKLRRLETSCGCLTQQIEQDVIQPGETGRFELWIQTASQSAVKKQYTCQAIYGPADDSTVEYQADLVFRITLPEQTVVVTPKALIFHQPNNQITERPIDVTDLRFDRLKVLDATSRSPWLKLNVLSPSELTTKERDEGVVGRVKVAVGGVPPGTHDAVILVRTDDEEFDVLSVPVRIFGPATASDAAADHTDSKARRTDVPNFED